LTGFFAVIFLLAWFRGVIDWAMDAKGRGGRDGGNDGVRPGRGRETEIVCFRDEDDASGDDTNDVERDEGR